MTILQGKGSASESAKCRLPSASLFLVYKHIATFSTVGTTLDSNDINMVTISEVMIFTI